MLSDVRGGTAADERGEETVKKKRKPGSGRKPIHSEVKSCQIGARITPSSRKWLDSFVAAGHASSLSEAIELLVCRAKDGLRLTK